MGVAAEADRISAQHVQEVKRDDKGVPLVSDIFDIARRSAHTPFLAYINADIMCTPALRMTLEKLVLADRFVSCRRRNLPLDTYDLEPITSFSKPYPGLDKIDARYGYWDRSDAIDLFVFPRDRLTNIPDFSIGRMKWDNWILAEAARESLDIIDISAVCPLYHPIHHYSSGWAEIVASSASARNRALAGDQHATLTQVTTHFAVGDPAQQLSLVARAERPDLENAFTSDAEREIEAVLVMIAQADMPDPRTCLGLVRQALFRNGRFVIASLDPQADDLIPPLVAIANAFNCGDTIQLETSIDQLESLANGALLKVLNDNKGALIWGAGLAGLRLGRFLERTEVKVAGYISSDGKGSEELSGQVVTPETVLKRKDWMGLPIIIASVYVDEIKKTIRDVGLDNDRSIYF